MVKEILKFTWELVKIPSQNGLDSEAKIANFVFEKLRSFGFPPDVKAEIFTPKMNGQTSMTFREF